MAALSTFGLSELAENAAVIAVLSYAIANLPEALPHNQPLPAQ
jgi:hypothetical protein